MQLDDTKYTTYVYDLEQELAEPDTSGEDFVLLPLAAKMISVPESILSTPAQGKELVLYTEPASLSIPKEQDCVRRAILDSRARARARIKEGSCQPDDANHLSSNEASTNTPRLYHDDPMDIDYGT